MTRDWRRLPPEGSGRGLERADRGGPTRGRWGVRKRPAVVNEIVHGQANLPRLAALTPRERDVLAFVAEGRSNRSVAARLRVTIKTVEGQVATVFSKLGLGQEPDDNRRVLAVLAYFEATH